MSNQESESQFRRIWDGAWHSKDAAKVIAASFTDDFLMHISSLPDPINRESWIPFVAGWQRAFPDGRMGILDLIAEGRKVWCYWVSTGTHSAEYLGIPATGKRVEYQGMDVYRTENGKLAECWSVPDALSLLRQLGALPG